MRRVQSAEAEARLLALLNEVEHGETIVITRHGKAIARLIPEAAYRTDDVLHTMKQIAAFRQTMPSIALSDIASARHDGHRH